MTTPKKRAPKSSNIKAGYAAPYLEHLIFTECSTKLAVDENGLPSDIDLSGAAMRLEVDTNRHAFTAEDDKGVKVAIGIKLTSQASSGKESTRFYEGSVHALGYFACDPRMTEDMINKEISSESDFFDGAVNTVHAIAARELERLMEMTGLPSPGIPLSQNHPTVKSGRVKE